MGMLLKHCRIKVLDGLLDLLWSHWTTLGVSGRAPVVDKWVLDPEALVLFTCSIGRYDPRLFDAMLEWLAVNQRFVNMQRLKTISRREGFREKRLLAAIAQLLMNPSSRAKWKSLSSQLSPDSKSEESLFLLKDGSPHPEPLRPDRNFGEVGLSRQEYVSRGAVSEFRADHSANLIMKLRTLFGVSSRCELIAYLMTHSEGNPTEIADAAGYSAKTIYNAVSEMYLSGTLFKRTKGRETLFRLDMEPWKALLSPGCSPAQWMNWPNAFRNLERFWLVMDNLGTEKEPSGNDEDELKLAFHELASSFISMPGSIPAGLTPRLNLSELGIHELCTILTQLIEFLGG